MLPAHSGIVHDGRNFDILVSPLASLVVRREAPRPRTPILIDGDGMLTSTANMARVKTRNSSGRSEDTGFIPIITNDR